MSLQITFGTLLLVTFLLFNKIGVKEFGVEIAKFLRNDSKHMAWKEIFSEPFISSIKNDLFSLYSLMDPVKKPLQYPLLERLFLLFPIDGLNYQDYADLWVKILMKDHAMHTSIHLCPDYAKLSAKKLVDLADFGVDIAQKIYEAATPDWRSVIAMYINDRNLDLEFIPKMPKVDDTKTNILRNNEEKLMMIHGPNVLHSFPYVLKQLDHRRFEYNQT